MTSYEVYVAALCFLKSWTAKRKYCFNYAKEIFLRLHTATLVHVSEEATTRKETEDMTRLREALNRMRT